MAFSGYSINGIALQDSTRGWKILRDGTQTNAGITNSLGKVPIPGRPGYNPAPSTYTEQVVVFVVRTTRAGLEPLLALCAVASSLTRTDDPTKEMYVELASAIPTSDAPMDGMFDVTITLSGYQGVYRDVTATVIGPTNVTSSSQEFDVLSGISAPIFDADLFLRGQYGQFTFLDAGGSSLVSVGSIPQSSSTGLLWLGAQQRAYLANESAPWTPVSDASQYVDQSGNGGFRLTPQLVSGNPSNRRVALTLLTTTQTSTTLRIRAKSAYRMN